MKWNFLYQITAASRTPWLGGYCPQIPVLSVLCPQLGLLTPPPNKIPRYATAVRWPSTCFATNAAVPIDVIPVFRTSHRPSSAKDKFLHRLYYVTLTSSLNRRLNCEQSTTSRACVLREQRPECGVCRGSSPVYANRPSFVLVVDDTCVPPAVQFLITMNEPVEIPKQSVPQ